MRAFHILSSFFTFAGNVVLESDPFVVFECGTALLRSVSIMEEHEMAHQKALAHKGQPTAYVS